MVSPFRMIRNELLSLLVIVVSFMIHLAIGEVQRCEDCIKKSNAEWCKYPEDINSTKFTRCYTHGPNEAWVEWCGGAKYVYKTRNLVTLLDDEDFTDPNNNDQENVIQIKPQRVSMDLAVGVPQELNISFKYVTDYSLELYYLMDLSKSMEVDRKTILSLAGSLVTELKKLTPYYRLGFGTFLDKVLLPYVNTHNKWLENPCSTDDQCRRPYGFQNILSLTNDTDAFIEAVENAKTSTNWDDPEGGLDALMQVMACDDIGWAKKKTRHLIVYVSGSAFKYAGDGKLAGLTKENDMKCHLDEDGIYTFSSIVDYPSVSQIHQTASSEYMYTIFAVKKKVIPLYEALTSIVVQSEASLLSEDSSNIIEIITNYYRDISQTLKLESSPQNLPNVNVTFSSMCSPGQEWVVGSAECDDVDVNKEVHFKATFNENFNIIGIKRTPDLPQLKVSSSQADYMLCYMAALRLGLQRCQLTSCPQNGLPIILDISPVGLEDKISIEINPLCTCPCEKFSTPNAKQCNQSGLLECGICICNSGYSGERCECKDEDPSLDGTLSRSCRPVNDTSGKDCSGRGVCECNKCQCKENIDGNSDWAYQGNFCEFSNFDCPINRGICSNHGICQFSKCVCDAGWSKEDCSCETFQSNCIYPTNNKVCDGHGDCECNQCQCHAVNEGKSDQYFGQFCEDCQNCTGLCDYYEKAIREQITSEIESEIVIPNTGAANITVHHVDQLNEEDNFKICRLKEDNGCTIRFSYDPLVDDEVYVEKEMCPEKALAANTFVVLIIAGIVLLGIILLLIWKCWVTIKDRREFEKFTQEWQEANFVRVENPLYRDPVTRVRNPLHAAEGDSYITDTHPHTS